MDKISRFFAGLFGDSFLVVVLVLILAVGLSWAIAYGSAWYYQNTNLDGSGRVPEAVVVKRTKVMCVGLGVGLSILFFLVGMVAV